jgi:UDP-2,3-diacylglucosamine pyrophosphatase LpxH
MERCKLVISDFHIGTGQLTEDGEVNPLEAFIFDSRFVSFLEYYMSDDFRKAEVELILNGDFLNTLQVEYGEERPTEVTEAEAVAKVRAIFAGHPEIFDALERFAATPRHRITYIVGNHDPAILWPAVRQELNQRLGVEVNYPGFSYSFDGIWVEHGQQYTAANRFDPGRLFIKDRRGEVILNLPWGGVWVIEYLNAIKKEKPWIDRVQPFSRYLLLGIFFNPMFALPALLRLVTFFIRRQLSSGRWKRLSEIRRAWGLLADISLIPDLEKEARKILARPGCHTVILGHNHQPAFRRFGKEKLYVNTGTWNDIIHLDIPNLGRTRRMTYAFIDYPEKRRPRTRLKIWKGTHQTEENVIF